MKLDELEKKCGKKPGETPAPIPDTCQRPSTTLPRLPQDASIPGIPEGKCKVIRVRTDPATGKIVRETTYEDVKLAIGFTGPQVGVKRVTRPDSHLGGVERDIADLQPLVDTRYAYPYSEVFTNEDWAGIS